MPKKGITVAELSKLVQIFSFVPDPRVKGRCKHELIDIIVISICAVICGAESSLEMEEFAVQREDWLRNFLALTNGIPSHDTIARVLTLVNVREMEKAFFARVKEIQNQKTTHISIDGKSIKGTERGFNNGSLPLHVVNVFSHESGFTLMQSKAKGGGLAETKTAAECLKLLDLKDVTVLVDAGLSTAPVISQVREKKGHYVVPIKRNQRLVLGELEEAFARNRKKQLCAETKEISRGRTETRTCTVIHKKMK